MAGIAHSLAFVAALGAGLMAGFFYAFSGLVMPSLGRRPAPEAIAAMQTINVVVLNPLFFALFFGTAALGIAIAAFGAFALPAEKASLAAVSAAVYLVGNVGVTMARNVPMNEALKAANPAAAASESLWRDYLRDWTWWNSVRTLACVAASAGYILVLW